MTHRPVPAARSPGGVLPLLLAAMVLCLLVGGPARAAAPAPGVGDPDVSALRARGWPVPGTLPRRLRLVSAAERRLDGRPLTGTEGTERTYVHLGYSDGESVVSVFIQKGRLDATSLTDWHARERFGHTIWVREPGSGNAIWSSGDYVYTVLADAPADVVDAAVAALPHEDEPGFWERLARSVDRALDWVGRLG